MRERARILGLRTRCARPPNLGRYSTCDCRTSPGKVRMRLARSCVLLDAKELRDSCTSGRRSMCDDGRCSSLGGARDIAQRCDVEAPLRARWPGDAIEDGRRLNARWSRDLRVLAERYRTTLAVEARCCARRRALPPRSSWWWRRRPAGRRSGEFPAMS
ncbi:hypothetical protein F511_43728 [Dorcoceras hygrometricum]|uniref:Uncharacterized protein n=1 Tax=Dorcoceras hygrometricum TaxID=472368 RepID=A0A2Z7CMA4_9LAMI|nr:hypothetical protein F511_43728 [Dorcoceras hygrometricum]